MCRPLGGLSLLGRLPMLLLGSAGLMTSGGTFKVVSLNLTF